MKALYLAIALALAGCVSGGFDGVRQGLTNTANVVSGACNSFAQADRALQEAILRSAKDKADAQAKIGAYRKGQSATVKACLDAQAGIAAADATLTAVETGGKSQNDLAQATIKVWELVQEIYTQMSGIGALK